MKQATLFISRDGTVTTIYNDKVDLRSLGKVKIQRASHVEPDDNGMWWADMAPVGGPKLGPYDKRQTALDEEVVWLDKNLMEAIKKVKEA